MDAVADAERGPIEQEAPVGKGVDEILRVDGAHGPPP
jgi:hypothetical protein